MIIESVTRGRMRGPDKPVPGEAERWSYAALSQTVQHDTLLRYPASITDIMKRYLQGHGVGVREEKSEWDTHYTVTVGGSKRDHDILNFVADALRREYGKIYGFSVRLNGDGGYTLIASIIHPEVIRKNPALIMGMMHGELKARGIDSSHQRDSDGNPCVFMVDTSPEAREHMIATVNALQARYRDIFTFVLSGEPSVGYMISAIAKGKETIQ